MLLFIIIPASFAPRFVNFNTSHVTVYHKGTQLRKEQTKNFNTSHVTVYQSGSPYLSTVPRFQYISCYCLSDSHCMSLETQWYFNTSHVTVYHNLLSVYYSANHHFNTSHVTVYRIRTV